MLSLLEERNRRERGIEESEDEDHGATKRRKTEGREDTGLVIRDGPVDETVE